MYPNLYFALKDLIGIDIPFFKLINSFGLFVALAFVTAGFFLKKEFVRLTDRGVFKPRETTTTVGSPVSPINIAIQSLLGFLFGWKFIYLALNASNLFVDGKTPQAFLFSLEGNILWGLLGALLLGGYQVLEAQKSMLKEPRTETLLIQPHEHIGSLLTVAAIGGILGAKLFHLIEYPDQFIEFFKDPSLNSFIGGLTIYGGLIVGGLSVALYCKVNNLPFLHVADASAPVLMLGYGVGRIGCQVSGDGDWGIVNNNPKPSFLSWIPDWVWSYQFPNNVNNVLYKLADDGSPIKIGRDIVSTDPWEIYEGYGRVLIDPVYPTSFYETLMATAIFCILWALRKRLNIAGMLFSIYLIFNGFERFWIEKVRVNAEFDFLGLKMTQAELISVLLMTSGLILFTYLYKNRNTVNAIHKSK